MHKTVKFNVLRVFFHFITYHIPTLTWICVQLVIDVGNFEVLTINFLFE